MTEREIDKLIDHKLDKRIPSDFFSKVNKMYEIIVGNDEFGTTGLVNMLKPISDQYISDSRIQADGKSQFQKRDIVISFFYSWKIVAAFVVSAGTFYGVIRGIEAVLR